MKTMKKLMMSLGFAALIAGSAAAQAPERKVRTPEERAQHQTDRMTKDLGLSAEQTEKVKAINLKYADQVDDMRGEAKDQKDAQREAMKGMRDQRNADLKAVLTPEQYDKMVKEQEAMQAKRKAHLQQRKAPEKGQ